ncbi:GerAB/ArcD/ProY family transporter [Papillibacter cinnamivorans]|uniref:Spore germination protein KB n=1 Tax=Papillibacter cinnamivorans DSM 12816 TaxID=1122930 RepID=A0A1W2CY58_9FIRM|nr:endospore germination permease [Papillibacter cinnamivorans]SMC90100.1 spore germination protein KB [Papillibacter cinnamivorans DSM 12816]
MNNGKEQILSAQLMFSVGCFIQSSTLLTSFIADVAGNEAWIAVIASYGLSMLLVRMYVKLAKLYPGKSIVQISEAVFGPVLGKILSCFYIWFFFSLAILNTSDVGFFVNNFIMPETPKMAILLMFIFVCAWAVRRGVETIMRYGQLFLIMGFSVVGLFCILLFKDMSFDNLMPVFAMPVMKYVQSIHIVTIIPFCEILAFTMVFPYVKDQEKIGRSLYIGMTLGAIHLLVVVLRDISVLGPVYTHVTAPSFQVTRLINIGNVITRMEFFYEVAVNILIFFKVSVLLFAAVLAVAQTFHIKSYRSLVIPIAVLVICISMAPFISAAESGFWGSNIAPFYSAFFEIILPFFTLIAALIRSMIPEEGEAGLK